jgi:hypothetical protein
LFGKRLIGQLQSVTQLDVQIDLLPVVCCSAAAVLLSIAAAGWTTVAVANGPGSRHLTGKISGRIIGLRCTRCLWRQADH